MKDTEVFPGKTLSQLLQDAYNNSRETRADIQTHITELFKHVNSVQDASILAPIVAQFLGEGIKNDEHILKIAAIVQRLTAAELAGSSDGSSELLSDREKEELLKNSRESLETVLKKMEEANIS